MGSMRRPRCSMCVGSSGHADTRPRAPNDTPENRSKNRRVDISIIRGKEIDEYRSLSVAAASTDLDIEKETSND